MPTPPIMSEGAVEGGAGGGGMSTPGGGTLLEDQNGEGSASQLDIHAGATMAARAAAFKHSKLLADVVIYNCNY